MKFLCIDPAGDALDLSIRAAEAGHVVSHFIRDAPDTKEIGQGLVNIVRDFRPEMAKADLIFCADNSMFMREIQAHRKVNPSCCIVGCCPEVHEWEISRKIGQKILHSCGIDVAPFKEFSDYDSAIRYVKKRNERLVCKPDGDADKAMSYCSCGPADLVFMLERWKKTRPLKESFIIQDFIEGIEMSTGGWFGPSGFNEGLHEDFEDKKLLADGLGPNTGSMGAITRYTKSNLLARKVLRPLEEKLYKAGYIGCIDVSVIIDKSGNPWPLEFTCRPGYPSLQIEQILRHGDPIEWLYDLCEGTDARNVIFNKVACGVMVKILGSADKSMTHSDSVGVPIYGYDKFDQDHLHLYHAMAASCPCDGPSGVHTEIGPCSAGPYVAVVTGLGDNVDKAQRAAYDRVCRLKLPLSAVWRGDIGRRLASEIPELHKLGYAKGLNYA